MTKNRSFKRQNGKHPKVYIAGIIFDPTIAHIVDSDFLFDNFDELKGYELIKVARDIIEIIPCRSILIYCPEKTPDAYSAALLTAGMRLGKTIRFYPYRRT